MRTQYFHFWVKSSNHIWMPNADFVLFPKIQWCRNWGGQGGHWPPQYFADQRPLFRLGRADYPQPLLLPPTPIFFTFQHHWTCRQNATIYVWIVNLKFLVLIKFKCPTWLHQHSTALKWIYNKMVLRHFE